MHTRRATIGLTLGLSVVCLAIECTGADEPEGDAGALVQAALEAEAAGDALRRQALLSEALAKDPDCAAARWHAGFVRIDNRWLTLDQVHDHFLADPRIAAYGRLRDQLQVDPRRDVLLARWCQEQKLTDEARCHWLGVLRAQPNHEEALRALDMQWYNGQLLPRAQVARQRRVDLQASRELLRSSVARHDRYDTLVIRWERAAAAWDPHLPADMEAALAAEKSPHAVVLVNQAICRRSQAPKQPDALETVCRNWIQLLARERAHTKLVVLHAIGHPQESVRQAAADALRPQPREQYVPLLLSCARFPMELACSLLGSAGFSTAQFTLDVQGLERDVQYEHQATLTRVSGLDVVVAPMPENASVMISGGESPQQAAATSAWRRAAAGSLQSLKQQVAQYNATSELINLRVAAALQRATGVDLEADPRLWQAWWNEYLAEQYEVDLAPAATSETATAADPSLVSSANQQQPPASQPHARPVDRIRTSSNQVIQAPPIEQTALSGRPKGQGMPIEPWRLTFRAPTNASRLSMAYVYDPPSCFHRTTPVWTQTGPRAIEDIRPGDQVLSQNPTTGELAYKVVESVTTREPTPMVRLTAGGEDIVATLGHPFWVINQRWTMAKHLREGMLLHTVSGPLPIAKLELQEPAKAWYDVSYNLQVADFHTFFVGQHQILVHHLSMLSVLDEGSTRVPGL
ncbi:MAG: HINT domain-containing protein [Pirellulaceae bacterium]|jgi:hypothetical protein|nr:HINT domain-containing protein [Pirellulaceae bacterium]